MKREQMELAFREDFDDPGSVKSGEYLEEHILRTARRFVCEDRKQLVEIMADWLKERIEPHTMLAVSVAGDLMLDELQEALQQLKNDIEAGRIFMKFYVRRVDAALKHIAGNKT